MTMTERAVGLLPLFLLGATGCVTPEPTGESLWPPADFAVDARRAVVRDGDVEEIARFRVFHDGLAVWREACGSVGGSEVGAAPFPVFRIACCYRMRSESLRMLSRRLDQAGIADIGAATGDERDPDAPVVAIRYRGFGRDRVAYSTGEPESGSDLRRVLDVLQDYMPPGARVAATDLGGAPIEPALLRVPAPRDSLSGALQLHRDLCAAYPEDLELVVDTFALAVAANDAPLARRLAQRAAELDLAAHGPGPANPAFPTETPRLEEQLRAIVEVMRR